MKVPLLCLIAHAMSKPTADTVLGTGFGSFLINPWDYILKWSPTPDHRGRGHVNGDQTKNHLLLTTTRLIGFITLYSGDQDQRIDLAHKRFYNILDPTEGYMLTNQYKVKIQNF